METPTKKAIIKGLVLNMLSNSHQAMIDKIDRVLDSGAVDTDSYDVERNSMLLPKAIVTALLEREADQYNGRGTSFEKSQKSEILNLRHFI